MEKAKTALKILHIGNIANNAYNNAKLLNRSGYDNDVICYDYYHVMGTPEWEDADFRLGPKDDFYPNWAIVYKKGYRRPKWFSQGPVVIAIRYLMARNDNRKGAAALYWFYMNVYRLSLSVKMLRFLILAYPQRHYHLAKTRSQLLRPFEGFTRSAQVSLNHAVKLMFRLKNIVIRPFICLGTGLYRKLRSSREAILQFTNQFSETGNLIQQRVNTITASLPLVPRLFVKTLVGIPLLVGIRVFSDLTKGVSTILRWVYQLLAASIRFLINLRIQAWYLLIRLRALPAHTVRRLRNLRIMKMRPVTRRAESSFDFDARVRRLIADWHKTFPARGDRLTPLDLEPYRSIVQYWDLLFDQYDAIVAYSTDPILPMICGRKYLAIEHGTLRTIPMEDTPQGRLTALAYAKSEQCFVTNFDCLKNAKLLAGSRVTPINHPYDEDHGLHIPGVEKARNALRQELDARFLFFFPTRHDWVEGHGFADKANDIFLEAFVNLRASGVPVGLICCAWGANVDQSRSILKRAGVEKYVKWVQPLGVVEFNRIASAVDIVVDQFELGAFGGVAFKAMSNGNVICTYLDENQLLSQYPTLPPVLNCRTSQEILEACTKLLSNRKDLTNLGVASREWIKRFHSADETIKAQIPHIEAISKQIS